MFCISKEISSSLKGIAVLLILICQFCGGGFGYRIFTPLGGIGVAIFLFLSGYGLNESFTKKGLTCYWRNKIVRIVFPYLICVVLMLPVTWLLYGKMEFIYKYWYLGYLFFWYFNFYITKKYFPKYANFIMLIIACLSFFYFSNLQSEQSFSFIAGVIVSTKKIIINSYKQNKIFYFAVFLFTIGTICLALKQLDCIRAFAEDTIILKLIQLGIKFPCGLALILFYNNLPSILRFNNILNCIGIVSLETYLVQMPLYKYINCSNTRLILSIVLLITLVTLLHICVKKFRL